MTPQEAKKIIAARMRGLGLPALHLTARTVGFADLARDTCIFVSIHGWSSDPRAYEICETAQVNGFRVEFA